MTNLKSMRIERNLTQNELAIKCNMSLGSLKAYEQGFKSIDGSKLRTLAILATALNCKIEDLLEDVDTVRMIKKIYK